MENPKSSDGRAWLFFGLSTVGMLVFAGLYFLSPKTSPQIQTVTDVVTNTVMDTVTNEVVREVSKEVDKYVNVPAAIPEAYVNAMNLLENMTNATYVTMDQALFGMKDVRTSIVLDTAVSQVITEDDAKAKFELTLRRNNIVVNPASGNTVLFTVSGFWDASYQQMLCYSIICEVDERQWVYRNGEWHMEVVTVWTKGSFGTVGRSKGNDALLGEVEKSSEVFANDFLSSNPKPTINLN